MNGFILIRNFNLSKQHTINTLFFVNTTAESNHLGYSRRWFALVINYLIQHDFFSVVLSIVHFLHPQERVCSFEFFGNAALIYQLGKGEVDLTLCFLLGFVEVLIERARGEKRSVGAAAVLFEMVEAHFAVLTDGVIGLLGECQVGIHNAVSFSISEFHNQILQLNIFYKVILPFLSNIGKCVKWLFSFLPQKLRSKLR